ncbi:MAG: GNAT family N-acetyltransferase [Oscillospiraceae bacterium]|jgi:GNAT superfamily N-acetyltransferase|nr:GNAT family N-acetyltransferase [Oscillospiraceae bacterium]
MKFVELEKSQYPLLAKHYAETYNAPPWNDQWTEAFAFEKLSEMMDCRDAFGLVCYDDNDNFAGVILGNPEIYFNCKQFFIKDFFVALSLQGKGIGSLLIVEFEKRLKSMGIDKVYLFTSKGERTEDFYNKRGFKTWSGMVLMGKNI